MLSYWILIICIGLIGGVIGGMFGVGGGVIIVPLLTTLLNFDQAVAQGTTLVALLLPVSIFATWEYYKKNKVLLVEGAIIGLCICLSSYFGAKIGLSFSSNTMKTLFGLLLIFVGFRQIDYTDIQKMFENKIM